MNKKVVVFGASPNPKRYAYRAVELLMECGYCAIPVYPKPVEVCGMPALTTLDDITESIDTLTLYVGSKRSLAASTSILKLRPRRIIFNPGAENPALENLCQKAGIETVNGCTLVMLKTGQF